MANSYSQIYLQAVFAVKYRAAVLDKTWQPKLQGVIGNLINETGCKTIIVNGVEDHMHCFLGLKPVVSVSDLMQVIKGKSSKYINVHNLTKEQFEWQPGYGIFSYSQRDIDQIYNYVKGQEAHHQKQSFKDEYLELLKEFEVGYDEQYLFEELI
ncbi:MAG: IS200/IS605 family transposase [Ferruginibacter sp.]|nr:IS200/IS605 family transposase [Bacteroidota bacterium]MBX2935517.1 IS200/IS605 family transposase [Ferruginibacter sp.]